MIGRTIGKYRFLERLGRGGMGTVYKAVDETLDREVAIKVLNPELSDSEVMRRFRAEATTLAKLNHPEIATIYEIFRSDDDLLMVMELVRGETLDQLAQRCGPLPPERAAYLVAQVLGALEHAHSAGIVHRDLKPANVMVNDHGVVKIMDFGIARVAGAEHLTSDGRMMGTPAYMAPEQVVAKEVDTRADLYSAGVLFYRLLTGNLPFQADTAIGMVQKQLSDAPTPAHVHRHDVPDWCETVLARALQKSPADRYQTAEQFRTDLLAQIGAAATERTGVFAAAHGVTTQSLPTVAVVTPPRATAALSVPTPTPKPKPAESPTVVLERRHFAIAGVLLAVLAVGVAVLAYLALRRQPPPSSQPAAAATATIPADASASAPPPLPLEVTRVSPLQFSTPPATASRALSDSAAATGSTGGLGTDRKPAVALSANGAAAKPSDTAEAVPPPPTATPAPESPTAALPAATPRSDTPSLPAYFFDAKTVVAEGGKNREHETRVLLAEGRLTVTEGNDRIITTLLYANLVGITVSNSKQPLWNSPQGPAELMKVEAGKFGFLKGGRNWLGLRTADASLVMRVDDDDLRSIIAALEARTGKKVVRVLERKD